MTAEEQAAKELQEKLNALKADIKTAIEQENAEALKTAIEAANLKAETRINELKQELDAQKNKFDEVQLKIKKSELNSVAGFLKNNNKALKQVAELLKSKNDAKAFLQVHQKSIVDSTAIEDGAAAIITRTQTNFGSNMALAQVPAVERIDAFDVFENSGVTLVPIVGNGTSVPYVDEVLTGDAEAQNPEGSTKAEIDAKYVERVAYTKTYAGWTGVSDQMLEDIVLLQTWVFDSLRRKLKEAYNNAFFNASGTLGTMTGLTSLASVFSSTGLELGAGAAVGIFEVINAAITQARASNFNVDRVWMNPIDYYKMISERSDQGRVNSVVEAQALNGYIGTARIQLTNYVTAGQLYVAEAPVIRLIYRSNNMAMPEIGLSGDDFKNNMRTIRAHVRLENVIPVNDRAGVVKVADIAAAITALATDPV